MSRTALRALPFAADQSEPPILDRAGASPPTYFVSWSSCSVGMKSLSPGCPRLEGAYSMSRYSRTVFGALRPPACTSRWRSSMNLPIPCVSCTTKSPALSCNGSTTEFARRLASFFGCRES